MKIIFATNNQNKADEIRAVLPPGFSIETLKNAGIDIDIPEPYDTLQDNAAIKAETIFQMTNRNCFSEDTGLEVYSLNNEPGVHSARYAGENRSFDQNIAKLLIKLSGEKDRKARFRTVICLILDGKKYFFEGVCEGTIIPEKKGNKGFGYDPVFMPDGTDRTFGEMSMEEKNRFSHRKKATDRLVEFLNNYITGSSNR